MDDPKGHWTSDKTPLSCFPLRDHWKAIPLKSATLNDEDPHWWYFNILHSRIPWLPSYPPISLARMILSSGQTNHISHKPQVTRAVAFLEFAKCLKGFGGWTIVLFLLFCFRKSFFKIETQKKLWSAEYLYIFTYISIIYRNHLRRFAFFELFEPCILSKHLFRNTCQASPPSSVRKLLLGVMFLGCHWIHPSEHCGHPQFFGLYWGFKKHHQ